MMLSVVILYFTLIVQALSKNIANSLEKEQEVLCAPGSQFNDFCNKCLCTDDGTSYTCTLEDCNGLLYLQNGTMQLHKDINLVADLVYVENTCKPHTQFKEFCNTCTCVDPKGQFYLCTSLYCDHAIYKPDGSLRLVQQKRDRRKREPSPCASGIKLFRDYCNYCYCFVDQVNYACTDDPCDLNKWNKDGSKIYIREKRSDQESEISEQVTEGSGQESDQKQVCEPDKEFKSYCNRCLCSKDGTTYKCTNVKCHGLYDSRGFLLRSEILKYPKPHWCKICVESNRCNTIICEDPNYWMRHDDQEYIPELTPLMIQWSVEPIADILKRYQNRTAKHIREKRSDQESSDDELVCEPNKEFKRFCNQCLCSKDGKSYKCTNVECHGLYDSRGFLLRSEIEKYSKPHWCKVCVESSRCNTILCEDPNYWMRYDDQEYIPELTPMMIQWSVEPLEDIKKRVQNRSKD